MTRSQIFQLNGTSYIRKKRKKERKERKERKGKEKKRKEKKRKEKKTGEKPPAQYECILKRVPPQGITTYPLHCTSS